MLEPEITPELITSHGLDPDEYNLLLEIIGRQPTFTELGIFSAMWNEHCSYKSSKKWLRLLPTKGKNVICGPGENAGIVDIGDNQAVVFKMESHNHPSYIEPRQGAATGVGGILRDVFTMGARPIAAMNALSFGEINHFKTRELVHGVVEGIGSYGNSFGVPTVGGEIRFDKSYNGNCLVNAFAAGLVDHSMVFYSAASGVGMPVVYLGAKTGRDGVGGATMASAEFDDTIEEKRPTVQVGDPFTEKRLLEACLELMKTDAVISIQDMGAAGLTCSAVEMGDKGNLGIKLNLDLVPTREENMTAYEMMLSESQERMLMVLKPEKERQCRAIFEKWDLDFAIVGETIQEDLFIIEHDGEIKAQVPLKALSGNSPEYDRPWVVPQKPKPLSETQSINPIEGLQSIISSPNYCSKKWVFQQYDSQVMADTIIAPGTGAGLVRVHGTKKELAFTADVTPRYVKADPFEGGKQAVAEAFRNLCAVGAKPIASTDNLNFGNPEKPEIMGQFVGVIKGMAEACNKLNYPVISGNVSLYNETNGVGINPTPTIGGVGLVKDISKVKSFKFKNKNSDIYVLGKTKGHLEQSVLCYDLLHLKKGPPPPIDLNIELKNGKAVKSLIDKDLIDACHDVSSGGIILCLLEMSIASNIGFNLKTHKKALDRVKYLFGEDQSRYIVEVNEQNKQSFENFLKDIDIFFKNIGKTSEKIFIDDDLKFDLKELSEINKQWFYKYNN